MGREFESCSSDAEAFTRVPRTSLGSDKITGKFNEL